MFRSCPHCWSIEIMFLLRVRFDSVASAPAWLEPLASFDKAAEELTLLPCPAFLSATPPRNVAPLSAIGLAPFRHGKIRALDP